MSEKESEEQKEQEESFPSQEEHEEGTHAAMDWPTEEERPEVDPVAQREIDELWAELHGQEQQKETNTEEEEK